jgi:hypothetical protein
MVAETIYIIRHRNDAPDAEIFFPEFGNQEKSSHQRNTKERVS